MRVRLRWLLLAVLATNFMHGAAPRGELPYRFLLVVGDQWKDETSTLIDRPGDFQIVAALLKSWGVPFDVLRLDQQLFDAYHLIERDGSSRYGTLIWMADPESVSRRDLSLLGKLVREQGANLVAVGDTVETSLIAELAGVTFVSDYKLADELSFTREHFITRGLAGREKSFTAGAGHAMAGVRVKAPAENVIASRGTAPFLTVRQWDGGGRVVWFGAERAVGQLEKQLVRDLFKRTLVWAQGYLLYVDYQQSVILFNDDFGSSDKTALSYWHYKTPSEEEIRAGMIEPLKRHGAVMDINVITGYADRKTHRILVPWEQHVEDEIVRGRMHDYASSKRGIQAGVAAGIFQIECHGWTHMLPDLESPPGPWWTAPMDGTGSLDWYNEFGDNLRKRDIPAAVQQDHIRRALDHIRQDFQVRPLILRPGGSLFSSSFGSNTSRIAGQMGFALTTGSTIHFVSPDRVILLEPISRKHSWAFDRTTAAKNMVWSADAPQWIGSHDRDLAMAPKAFAGLLEDLGPGVNFMHGREYAAYLHARVARSAGAKLTLTVDYDPHYCAFFATNPSYWTLHVSDEFRQAAKASGETRVIPLPAGTGEHIIHLR